MIGVPGSAEPDCVGTAAGTPSIDTRTLVMPLVLRSVAVNTIWAMARRRRAFSTPSELRFRSSTPSGCTTASSTRTSDGNWLVA